MKNSLLPAREATLLLRRIIFQKAFLFGPHFQNVSFILINMN